MKTTEMNYTPIQLKLPVDMERIIEMVLVKISGLDRQNAKISSEDRDRMCLTAFTPAMSWRMESASGARTERPTYSSAVNSAR